MTEFRDKKPNLKLANKLNIYAYIATAIILLVVGGMRQVHFDPNFDTSFLAGFHSMVNAICSLALISAIYFVKTGNLSAHRNSIYVAMGLSVVFLTSYILYHTTNSEITFCKYGILRIIYFTLLISHVILAAVILPLILFTFIRAFTNQFDRHKKIARWVFPLWLYVTITGPICYLLLLPCH